MVEHFHRTFKAPLMSRCKDSNWFTQLPWVLLELRTTPKDTLDVLAAEIVQGNLLVFPGEFFQPAISFDNLKRLRHVVRKFTPSCQTYKPPAKQHLPTDLQSATHIFLHNDSSKPPLNATYTGPFLVIRRTLKLFLLNIHGK
ncbi:uncharacterized protein [Palaemon carinicauda]|uniref:uncharacterized protein n=1 Tax=Palaemon carinicauda TaxID=392227 RepID=UPI0035B597B4